MSLSKGVGEFFELERTGGDLAVSGSGQKGQGLSLPLPINKLKESESWRSQLPF
jgi:hypothetical protein